MDLIIAEKPKVARTIASALGTAKRNAYGKISYYTLNIQGKEYAIASAVGHLYTLVEKSGRRDYPVFDIEWVPSYKANKKSYFTRPYVELLEKLGKKAERIIVACDFDIEGSLIGYNVYRFTAKGKPTARMKFSALTRGELQESYTNMLPELDFPNAYAGEARHMIDWYYGINLSRALMQAIRKAGAYKMLSIGRVQGPALDILVKREIEIKEFKPVPFWEIIAKVNGVEFGFCEGRIMEEAKAKELSDSIKKGDLAKIKTIEKKERKQYPFPPFDLTSLQTEAYKAFGFSPSKTLQIAQSLYEASVISYPRTASQKLPAKLKLPNIIKKLSTIKPYSEIANYLLSKGYFSPIQGKKDDPAHPAIHPTGIYKKLEGDEKKLYDLVVRRFLALFYPPAIFNTTKIVLDINGLCFNTSGSQIKEKSWLEIYPFYKSKTKLLPEFSEGGVYPVESKRRKKSKTKPPSRYSPATIIAELERRKLGTKATRSTIIDTLYKRGYLESKIIKVTDFGLGVWESLSKYAPSILDENLTRHIEEDMDKIITGKKTKDEVIKDARETLESILDEFKKNEEKIGSALLSSLIKAENNGALCPKCSKPLRIIKTKKGTQFVGCSNYPNCTFSRPLPRDAYVVFSKKKCNECEYPKVLVRKNKKTFEICLNPDCPSNKRFSTNNEDKH